MYERLHSKVLSSDPAPGAESSGKTTLALHAIAELQKTGGRRAVLLLLKNVTK